MSSAIAAAFWIGFHCGFLVRVSVFGIGFSLIIRGCFGKWNTEGECRAQSTFLLGFFFNLMVDLVGKPKSINDEEEEKERE